MLSKQSFVCSWAILTYVIYACITIEQRNMIQMFFFAIRAVKVINNIRGALN